ncbi:MAG: hypothetical protein LBC99_10420 [Spirochaetota bacterium]|jgi:hypothetical protein|nr:hypothetical protein [Spirochaetota bacterium]
MKHERPTTLQILFSPVFFILPFGLLLAAADTGALQRYMDPNHIPKADWYWVDSIEAQPGTGNIEVSWRWDSRPGWKYAIYRAAERINSEEALTRAEWIAELNNADHRYVDYDMETGAYFYAVTIIDRDGYQYFVPKRDQTYTDSSARVTAATKRLPEDAGIGNGDTHPEKTAQSDQPDPPKTEALTKADAANGTSPKTETLTKTPQSAEARKTDSVSGAVPDYVIETNSRFTVGADLYQLNQRINIYITNRPAAYGDTSSAAAIDRVITNVKYVDKIVTNIKYVDQTIPGAQSDSAPTIKTTDTAALRKEVISFFRNRDEKNTQGLRANIDHFRMFEVTAKNEDIRNQSVLFAGQAFYHLGEYSNAFREFVRLKDIMPDESRGWINRCVERMR